MLYCRACEPAFCTDERFGDHVAPREHPERPERLRRDRARAGRRRSRRPLSPRPRASGDPRRASSGARRRLSRHARGDHRQGRQRLARSRHLLFPTARWTAALLAAGGVLELARRGRRRRARQRRRLRASARPPRHAPIARWAFASSTTSPSPPPRLRAQRQARRHLRLGRAPRQRHRGHLRRGSERALLLDARVAAISRHRPRRAHRPRRRRRRHRQRALAAGHATPTAYLPAYRARIRPAIAEFAPDVHARLGRLRRPPRRSARRPRARRRDLRRPDARLRPSLPRAVRRVLEGGYDLDASPARRCAWCRRSWASRDPTARQRRALRRLRAHPLPDRGRHGRPVAGAGARATTAISSSRRSSRATSR